MVLPSWRQGPHNTRKNPSPSAESFRTGRFGTDHERPESSRNKDSASRWLARRRQSAREQQSGQANRAHDRNPGPDRSSTSRDVRRGRPPGRPRSLRDADPEAGRSRSAEGGRLRNRRVRIIPLTNQLKDDILAPVPNLRAFAISLSGN